MPGPLLVLLGSNPFQVPPPFEELVGDLTGAYLRRINIHHRIVYEVFPKEEIVRVLRMWVPVHGNFGILLT